MIQEYECKIDGDQLCITNKGFINLQESPAYFIPLTDEQREGLQKQLKQEEKPKCEICDKELKPGDKVIQTFTIENYNFQVDMNSYTQQEDDLNFKLCRECCEHLNFREYQEN